MATARMRLEDFHLISWAECVLVCLEIKYAANLMGIRLVSFLSGFSAFSFCLCQALFFPPRQNYIPPREFLRWR